PVDMYVPGCPPRPEMLLDGILKLHAKIMDEPLGPKRAALAAEQGKRTELVASSVRFAPGKESPPSTATGKSEIIEARKR
ncbi:MAG: NADH-quinone oxidoreductase subunit B, partial [Pseudonocardiaceae bacterium]|nr:NADH-quinone oxidoreductase subunit B [Pseudonocardiaceae bacterium]